MRQACAQSQHASPRLKAGSLHVDRRWDAENPEALGLRRCFRRPHSPTPAIGSAAYIPPETASGKPLTRRSDLYSLGGYSILSLRAARRFLRTLIVELMHKQCYTLPERPAMLVPEIPPELDDFICSLLDKNPPRRPANAAAVIEDLERLRGKLERKGEKLAWPQKITPDTAEAPALPAALGGLPEGKDPEPESRPLLKASARGDSAVPHSGLSEC